MARRVLAMFGLAAALCAVSVTADTYLSFTQPLDHNCPHCDHTFEQSYVWINDTGYERGGPVVLFLGGPSSKFNYQTRLSQFVKFATIFQCTFLLLEHRFYGISLPAAASSSGHGAPFSAANLEYLTVEQALLDAQAFATAFQREHMPAGTKWIIAGEADSASLAAWYAHRFLGDGAEGINKQFVAAVASSAVLQAEADFSDFFQQFAPAARNLTGPTTGAACNAALRAGAEDVARLLSLSPAGGGGGNGSGRAQVARLFNACEDEVAEADEFFFKYAVAEVVASSLVLNTPPAWSVNRTCQAALAPPAAVATATAAATGSASPTPAEALAAAFAFNMNFEYQLCLEVCNGTSPLARVSEVVFRPLTRNISDSSSSSSSSSNNNGTTQQCVSFDEAGWLRSLQNESNPARAWWWQRCTQLGQFHGTTSGSPDNVFFDDIDVDKVMSYCGKIFPHSKAAHGPDTRRFNEVYGGVDGFSVQQQQQQPPLVYFANGNMDPLHHLAPRTSSPEKGYLTVNYVGGQDSFGYGIFTSPADPPSLTAARNAVGDFLNASLARA